MTKLQVIFLCILSNLLVGNGILVFTPSSANFINYDLMIGMSVSAILCYLLSFRTFNFREWGNVKLLVSSIILCIVIILIGCTVTSVITGFRSESHQWHELPLTILVGFVLGMVGNIGMFPISLLMGGVNFFWFRYYKRLQ